MGKEVLEVVSHFIKNLANWMDKISIFNDYKPFGIAIVFFSKKEKKYFSITYDVNKEEFSYKNKEVRFHEYDNK